MAKIKVTDLLADFQRMRDEHWDYEANAEEEYTVDCSGAFVWAYRQHGAKIYHGSNRIARVYVHTLLPIEAAEPGMAAFKVRKPGDAYYNLPDAYQQGGEYYNGDVNDYYHIGLIDTDGISVLNARSTADGFVDSPISQGWAYCAYLKDVEYEEEPSTVPEPTSDEYIVTGGNLNMRSGMGKQYPAIKSIPDGSTVQIIGQTTGEWVKVKHERETGYVMRKFLVPVGGSGGGSGGEDEEYITIPRNAWEALKTAFYALEGAIDK